MKRLIVTGPREVSFEEVAMPECPADGLLVRARMTAVSAGTEIRVYRGIAVDEAGKFLHERVPFELPTENGYSMVGLVEEVGRNISAFSTGDRVFVPSPHKQFAAVPATLAIKLPDDLSDERAVFLNIMEVAHISIRRGKPAPGANVAVIGQGVIGLSALAYCRAFGFRTAVLDTNSERLKISTQMGADLAVSPREDDSLMVVTDFFDGAGADLVLEAASNWEAIRTAMQIARHNGKVVVVARHTNTPHFNPVGHPFLGKQLELLTTYGYPADGQRWDRRDSFGLTIDWLTQGRLNIDPMITHRFGWRELPQVYHRLDQSDPEIVGAVLDWS